MDSQTRIIFESVFSIESHTISGIALIPRVSRNMNFYLPEELKRADNKTVPLNWEHNTTIRPIGQVTFHYDKDLMQLRYEGTITDDTAYDIIKNNTYHVSIGASPSTVRSICGSEQCYNVPEGLNFQELSLVSTPGIPESTINLIESKNLVESYHNMIGNYEFCNCTEAGLSPHAADRPDSDFAYVPSGGNKSDRKFPIYDKPHVQNALARFSQASLPADQKKKVLAKICRAAKKFGIDSNTCSSKEGFKDQQHEFMGSGQTCELCNEDKNNYIHGVHAVYPDTKDSPAIQPIGYEDDEGKKPIMATETITDMDRMAKHLESFIMELIDKKLNEKITQNTHKFIKSDDATKCQSCGQGPHSAIHSDAPVHNIETCNKCGGIRKTENICTKCGGHKK